MFDNDAFANWDPEPFRAILRGCGFAGKSLKALGIDQKPPRGYGMSTPAVPVDSKLGTALRLFQDEEPVAAEDAMRLFGGELHRLVEIGLLSPSADGRVAANVRLVAVEDGWFAADPIRRQRRGEHDFVMGLSPTTRILAGLTPAWAGARVLDLGTGAGWNALNAARRGAEVVATDINSRATAICRFNARLRGVEVGVRTGDLFEPVAGETFDVIASNLPFVITPDNTYLFRDHPRGGEFLCREVVRRLPSHLRPDGIGVLLLNWPHASDDDWSGRPLEWSAGSGCHRWLLRTETLDPGAYAHRWLLHEPEGGEPAAGKFQRWLRHYHEIGAGRFSFGFLILVRAEGPCWTRVEERTGVHVEPDASEELRRIIRNESWLAKERSDEEVLEMRWGVPDGARAEVDMELGETGWSRRTIRLRSPRRLSYDGQIDENLLRLLEILRRGGTAADMVSELRSQPQFSSMPLEEPIAGLTRELVRYGMLEPPAC